MGLRSDIDWKKKITKEILLEKKNKSDRKRRTVLLLSAGDLAVTGLIRRGE